MLVGLGVTPAKAVHVMWNKDIMYESASSITIIEQIHCSEHARISKRRKKKKSRERVKKEIEIRVACTADIDSRYGADREKES